MMNVMAAGEARGPLPSQTPFPGGLAVSAGLALMLGALTLVPAASAAPAAQDVSGVWWATSYSPKIQIVGGGELPYNAAGKSAYEKNIAGLKSGELIDAARRFCVPDGIPRILATPYPFEIIHTPGQTTMIHELNHAIRVVTMDRPLPKDEELIPYPYYDGHSVGHWDGDTLVIDVTGFNGRAWLDRAGNFASDSLHVVERYTMLDANTVNYEATLEDPDSYTKPWKISFPLYRHREKNARLLHFQCVEFVEEMMYGDLTKK
jgi:hypothetical protein